MATSQPKKMKAIGIFEIFRIKIRISQSKSPLSLMPISFRPRSSKKIRINVTKKIAKTIY